LEELETKMSIATERSGGGAVLKSARAGAGAAGGYGPKKKKWLLPVLVAAVVLAGGVTGWVFLRGGSSGDAPEVLLHTVQRGALEVNIPLSGELKAIRNVEIRNLVEGQTTILWLIPEGQMVAKGEKLVELASDTIQDRLEESRIKSENATAARVNAEETLKIQEMQNESDLKAGETNAKLSEMEYLQFDKGDGPVQLATFVTALANAKTDLERKVKDRERVEELSKKGFVSDNDVLDAQIAERDSKNKLDTAESNLDVWKKYAEPRQRQTLERKRDESLKEWERVKRKAAAALLLKQADLRAKESTERVEGQRFKSFQVQLAACTVRAPQQGMVVYQSSIQQGGQNSGLIEEGAQVRQNQILIQLPDTSKMYVEVRLAEQLTDRVKTGQEAVVTVDAMPGRVFHGKVEDIAVLPDSSNRWMNPNLKEYPTKIPLEESPKGAKPGLNAKVEILVGKLSDAITVPLQAVFSGGGQTYVFVGNAAKYEKRVVRGGVSNATKMEITQGLKEGETVLLSRPKDAPEDGPTTATSRGAGKRVKKAVPE